MMDPSRGYIAMPRSIFDHKAFSPEPLSEREAFLFIVAAAAWKPRQDRIGRAVVDLQRGQFAASTRFLAARWGWSEARVRRFFIRLSGRRTGDAATDAQSDAATDALIDAVSTRDVTVITIRNYNEFNKSASPDKSERDAPINAVTDAPIDALRDSKSTQIGETNLEEDKILPFPNGNGGAREQPACNVVTLAKAKPAPPVQPAKIPDPEFTQTPAGTVFGECRKYLQRTADLTPDQARRILGRWRKSFSDGQIIDAISRAQREEAQDPIGFVTGCLKRPLRDQRPTGAMSAIAAIEGVEL